MSPSVQAAHMYEFWVQRNSWANATFGPPEHRGPRGPLDHLAKEAVEARDEPDKERQKMEIIDCLFLVFDAANRAGMSFGQLVDLAHTKLALNRLRKWPDWRTADPEKAVEHDRSHDGSEEAKLRSVLYHLVCPMTWVGMTAGTLQEATMRAIEWNKSQSDHPAVRLYKITMTEDQFGNRKADSEFLGRLTREFGQDFDPDNCWK